MYFYRKNVCSVLAVALAVFIMMSTVLPAFSQSVPPVLVSDRDDGFVPEYALPAVEEVEPSSVSDFEQDSGKPGIKDWLFAGAGVLASNAALFSFNHFVMQAEYAEVDGDTIYDNLSHQWVWDQDTFVVNQLGHPYQGSFYFCSGRANGLSFMQSLLCTSFGSVTWEYFCENERQSVNDLICTTFGGAAFGEVLHRLYLEAHEQKSPFAFILSPMDALTGVITGKTQSRGQDDGITSFQNYLMIGSVFENEDTDSPETENSIVFPVNFSGGFNLEYGNAFTCRKNVPYSFFTMDVLVGGTKDYFAVSIRTEGILYRFGTGYTDNGRYMLGCSMLFDASWKKNTAFSVDGLGLLYRMNSEYDNGVMFGLNANASWVLFGGNDYYNLYSGNISLPDDGVERRLYDYGTGFYTRCELSIGQKSLGTFGVKAMFCGLFSFETAVPAYGSDGFALIFNGDLSYDHIITKNFSLGIDGNLYTKYGCYYESENVFQTVTAVSLYGKRLMK